MFANVCAHACLVAPIVIPSYGTVVAPLANRRLRHYGLSTAGAPSQPSTVPM